MLTFITEIPFLRGLIMGVLMAAPIGAVGVMCVKRAVSGAWLRALAVGLGSATVDALFGMIAGLGLTIIATFIVEHQMVLGLAGGLIVTGIGVATYLSHPRAESPGLETERLPRDFAKAFMLSIANPATFLGALGLFAALGPADAQTTRATAVMLVSGVFCGSLLWWVFLAAVARLFRGNFGPQTLERFSKVEGILIAVLGLAVIVLAAGSAMQSN
jgi:threonine/homoserine/homoserine lactone efflux protein